MHKLLESMATIFTQKEEELLCFCRETLLNYDYVIKENPSNWVYGEGQIPLLLVAHVDIVHKRPPQKSEFYYHKDKENVIYASHGIGADDRAGVLGIIELLTRGMRPHVLFTNHEETGGQGAKLAASELESPPVNFMIELDRMNSNDCVFYDCANDEFVKYIECFGYKKSYGSFTDISILMPKWNLCGVNLSVGYYRQHSTKECIDLDELDTTLERVLQIGSNLPDKAFEYIEKTCFSPYNNTLSDDIKYPINIKEHTNTAKIYDCLICDKSKSVTQMDQIVSIWSGYCKNCSNNSYRKCDTKLICPRCYEECDIYDNLNWSWCDNCNHVVEV